jgi:membrane protease YdiL (CAAX protease family)
LKNRWFGAMTFFVVALYSFLLAGHFFLSDKKMTREREIRAHEQAQVMKAKEQTALKNLSVRPALVGALCLGFAAVFIWGLYLDVVLGAKKWRPKAWLSLTGFGRSEVSWGLNDVFQGLLFLFFLEGCLFLIQVFARSTLGLNGQVSDSSLLMNSFARDIGVTCFVLWVVLRRYGQSLKELGFRIRPLWGLVKSGILAYVAVIPPLILGFVILSAVMYFFSMEPEPQAVVQIYLKDSTQPYLLFLTFFVAALGPVMEEIFFRGFAYAGLRKRFGVWPGAILSSAVFAALHMNLAAFFPIFFLGMFLAVLYEASGSLVPSITAHMLHNTVMAGLLMGFRNLSSG